MIRLNHINIEYDGRPVFEQASYHASAGKINVIYGESGSGKSTLIQTLLFRHPCSYEYNGKNVSDYSETERAEFISAHISAVFQEPLFLEDLTLAENIRFVRKAHDIETADAEDADPFDIQGLYSQYPGNLSGGEKTRAALYIALIKQPDILILDEPTASLDAEHKEQVIEILQAYAEEHIVICSTHDHAFDRTDCYKAVIRDGRIIQQDCSFGEIPVNSQPQLYGQLKPAFSYIDRCSFHHHMFLKLLRSAVMIIGIVFLFISLTLNNAFTRSLRSSLNRTSKRELIAYRGILDNRRYSYEGEELPAGEQDVKKLYQISGIESIYPRIDYYTGYCYEGFDNVFPEYSDGKTAEQRRTIVLREGSFEKNTSLLFYVRSCGNGGIDDQLLTQRFGQEGIYVSEQIYQMLGGNGNHPELTFTLPVPMYNGISYTTDARTDGGHFNDSTAVECNGPICWPVEATLPLAGVVKDVNSQIIYVPEKLYMQYIGNLPDLPQEMMLYFVTDDTGNMHIFRDELPDEYRNVTFHKIGANRKTMIRRWMPSGYSAIVQDLDNIYNVIADIQNAGFQVDSDYVNTGTLIRIQENTRRVMIVISASIVLILSAASLIIQYLRRERVQNLNMYLYVTGYDSLQRKRYVRNGLIRKALIHAAAGMFLYFVVLNFLLQLNIAFIQPRLSTFAGILVFTCITEFLVPDLLYRKEIV